MKVFITGGNGGIGSAVKEMFVNAGHQVIAPSSRDLDLSDLNALQQYLKDNPPAYDAVIHCAGYNPPLSVEDTSAREFAKAELVNTASLLEIVKSNSAYFKRQQKGYVVAIASLYASISRENRVAYACSKHALVGLIKTLALELGKHNILCNTVSPGYVDTKMFREHNDAEKRSYLASKVPLNRLAVPEDIAKIVYFLCSENNTYLNGQDIIADGGFMAGGFQ